MQHKKRKNWFLLVFMVCLMSTWICLHSVAYAHAYLVKSSPAANQITETPPHTIQIWFGEPVQAVFNSLSVVDGSGERVDQNDAHIDLKHPNLLECDLKSGLHDGTYSVNWRVVSDDGRPVQGIIPFQIGPLAIHAQPLATSGHGYLPSADMLFIRWLMYLGMLSYFGLLVFRFLVLPKKLSVLPKVQSRFQRMFWISWACIAVSVILNLPLQTKIDANLTFAQALHPQFLKTVISLTRFGHLWIIQAEIVFILFFLATLMAKDLKRLKYWIYLIAGFFAIGLFITKSMAGHAAATTHPIMSVIIDVFHLIAASIWLGSLLGFISLIPRPISSCIDAKQRELYSETIRRFSPWGIMSVLVLMLSGLYAALQQIPTLYALLHTNYGTALIVKLCIFLCMFALAVYHWLCGHFSKKKSKQNLHRTIWIEFGLGAILLFVTAILTNLPPALSNPGPITKVKAVASGETATLRITPNIAGTNTIAVSLGGKSGKPDMDIQQMTLSFTSLDMNMGTDTVRLLPGKSGEYLTHGLYLNMSGHWNIHLHILTNSFQNLDTDYKIVVGSVDSK